MSFRIDPATAVLVAMLAAGSWPTAAALARPADPPAEFHAPEPPKPKLKLDLPTEDPETTPPFKLRAPTPAPAPLTPAPRRNVRVDFVRDITDADFQRVYPRRGGRGKGTVRCRIAANGQLLDCAVVSESPEGAGFGEAALALARVVRVKMDVDPSPAGVMLTMPMTFNGSTSVRPAPPSQSMPAPPPRVSQLGVRQPPSYVDLLASETDGSRRRFQWTAEPTPRDFLDTYPPAALNRGLPGQATLDCRVGKLGNIEDCRISSEYPAGDGFGQAAIALTHKLKAQPTAKAVGQRIILPVSYRPPWQSATPYDAREVGPPPAPVSPPPKPMTAAEKRALGLWSAGVSGAGVAALLWLLALGAMALNSRRRAPIAS